jgi:hypothetical protein
MTIWSTGNRSDFGIEVDSLETETGFLNADVTFWIQGIPTEVRESLAGLVTSLANILSQPRRPDLDLPQDWSAAQIAEHLVGLLRRERTDDEDEQLFGHMALPFLDSARDRAVFLSRSGSHELLVLADKTTSRVLASTELQPKQFALTVRAFIDWIDSKLPSTGRARGSYVIS